MVNYLNKSPPRLAELGDSLRELTKKNIALTWEPVHTEAFDAMKKKLPVPLLKLQPWKILVLYLLRRPPSILPVKVSKNTKKHTWQLKLSLLQLLGPWKNSITFYMVKSFSCNQTTSLLKMCSLNVWQKVDQHSSTYKWEPCHMTLLSGIFKA